MDKQFALKVPCANCPFRKDGKGIRLVPGRIEGIIEGLLSGEHMTFHCHHTVHRADGRNFDDDGNFTPNDICQCPGAAAVARKFGRDTVLVQVASRLGVIPATHYDEALPLTIEPSELNIDREKARISG